jgi:uncharacterized protein
MSVSPAQQRPWLIAAWPGMGNVALLAAGHLMQKLGLRAVAEVPPRSYFDVQEVHVKDGIVSVPRLPRTVYFRSAAPLAGRELIILIGEAQPSSGTLEYAHEIVDKAVELGVERIVTFASMATQLHPTAEPRVFAAATTHDMLVELKRLELAPLDDGQIGGLNGLLLGVASEKNVEGMCLLGEMPFFAANVVNPKAAKAVLEAFSTLAGVSVDLDELATQAHAVDEFLVGLLEHMSGQQDEAGGEPDEEEEEEEEGTEAQGEEAAPPRPEAPKEPQLDLAARNRVEQLFEEVRRDRSRAVSLKKELDRLGVFKQYEGRFLDLFKRAE